MQQVLIDATKEPFPKLLHDSGSHSTYQQPLPQAFQNFAATPYRGDGRPIEGGAHTHPERAAAGLWTTPTDLARYAIEVEQSLEGKASHVLSAEMTRQMLTPGIGHWGLGLEIGGADSNPYFSHNGANAGFQNIFVSLRKERRGRSCDDQRRRWRPAGRRSHAQHCCPAQH
jgi:CubicO group peptidase (beta-lactamase class C family)